MWRPPSGQITRPPGAQGFPRAVSIVLEHLLPVIFISLVWVTTNTTKILLSQSNRFLVSWFVNLISGKSAANASGISNTDTASISLATDNSQSSAIFTTFGIASTVGWSIQPSDRFSQPTKGYDSTSSCSGPKYFVSSTATIAFVISVAFS